MSFPNDDYRNFNVNIPYSDINAMQDISRRKGGVPVAFFIREAIKDWLKKQRKLIQKDVLNDQD